ncbi:hypothetical protein [Chryseobacterium paridis]|uniref:Uncharacterized protein n=1 Tax=Chryseobacterium paridis TaxID=2800328 RepID=A0ABS1FZD6_9FLAO|nr:hypothetical protein [Chryseobacterium paridis]MBK1897573.1 hypothetical protein [Chryseobacterium paridis]
MEEKIVNIPELQFECYFLGNSWKVVRENNIQNINSNLFYGYPFYIIFEHIKIVTEQLGIVISKYGKSLSDFFPIELILKDMIRNKQGYWLNLGIDFIIEMDYLNESIVEILVETKNDRYFTQELRHKIRKIVLLNNYEY